MGWLPSVQGLAVLATAAAHAFLFARIFFARFVRRAKLVLDFASTLVLFHLVFCLVQSDNLLPGSFALILFLIQWIVLVYYGQSVCMEIELRPIMVNSTSTSSNEYELLEL